MGEGAVRGTASVQLFWSTGGHNGVPKFFGMRCHGYDLTVLPNSYYLIERLFSEDRIGNQSGAKKENPRFPSGWRDLQRYSPVIFRQNTQPLSNLVSLCSFNIQPL